MEIFKKQKIVKLITNNKFLLDEYPVQKYSKEIPLWFKDIHVNLHKYTQNTKFKHTVKACSGIWDFFKNVYIIRWNFDLEIDVFKDETFSYSPDLNNNMLRKITWFNKELYAQHTPISKSKLSLNTIKLELNWYITSLQKGKVLFMEPFFDYQRDYRIIPGIVEPKYVNDVNVIIEPLVDKIIIKRGQPALAFIPLENQNIEVSMGNDKDWDSINKNNYKQNTLGISWYEKYRKQE